MESHLEPDLENVKNSLWCSISVLPLPAHAETRKDKVCHFLNTVLKPPVLIAFLLKVRNKAAGLMRLCGT